MGFFSKIFKGITNIFKGVVDTIVNIGKGIVNFIGDVFSFVINPMGSIPSPNVGVTAGEDAKGITVTKNGTNTAIPVAYGYRRLGGSVVFAETNGTDNKFLYVCYVLCQGEIEGVRRLFIDDIELPTTLFTATSNTLPTGTIVSPDSGRFKNLVQLQMFNGASGDVQSTLLNDSKNWGTKVRTIPGIAYLACRFQYPEIKTQTDQDNNPWAGGIPRIQAEVLGKKVYDISQFAADSAGYDLTTSYANLPKTYSINPVNHLLDFLMDPDFGCGLQPEEIDADSFVRSANKCLQYVEYYDGQYGRAITGNSVVDTSQKLLDNVKTLVQGCRGLLPYVQGKYKIVIEDGGNATDIKSSSANVVYQVNDDDVIGGVTMRGEAKNTKFNQVVVNYVEPETDFQNQSVSYPETDSTLHISTLAEDNNEVLKGEFNFPTITNKYIAKDLAIMIFEKSRTQRQISFTGVASLMALVPGDIFYMTNSRLGLSNVAFRVVGMNIRVDSSISIEAVEHIPTVYPYITQDEADTFENPSQPDPIIPNPITPAPPTQPPGIVPPIDPDPNPPEDIEPNPPTDGTDSAGYPVAPIQNPVPPKAPDEVLMPDPSNVDLSLFLPIYRQTIGHKLEASDAYTIRDFRTDTTYPVDTDVTIINNITKSSPSGFYESKDDFNYDIARSDFVAWRNNMIRFTNKLPFSGLQCIADNTGTGINPWNTGGEYGGVIVYDSAAPAVGTTLTVTDAYDQLADYVDTANLLDTDFYNNFTWDSAGISQYGALITFSASHGLRTGDKIAWSNAGAWSTFVRGGSTNLVANPPSDRYIFVKVINSTQVELYLRYDAINGPNFPYGGVVYTDDGTRAFPTWTGTGTMVVVATSGTTQTKIETRPTFEKLKAFPTCSIWNPYEAWTRNQDVTVDNFTVSPSLGNTPVAEFESPVDTEILKRGPKGLYPKVFCSVSDRAPGIIVYPGTVGGGLQGGGYHFFMRQEEFEVSTTEGKDVYYAWPWAGGNKQNFNTAMLVTSPKTFFKIRFTTSYANADGSKYIPGQTIYKDGSAPTPSDPNNASYWDPAIRYDLPGWTYTNEKGETVTGYGIEAYLNYSIQQLSADAFETDTSVTTQHGLGD